MLLGASCSLQGRCGVTGSRATTTSGRGCPAQAPTHPPARHGGAAPPGRPRDCAVRVTNEQLEQEAEGLGVPPEEDDEYMELSQLQIPRPELGPLEGRVEAQYEEAIFTNDISSEDTEYWFTEPDGGWQMESELVRKLPVADTASPTADNFGDGRTALGDVVEGAVLKGTVTRLMLYHGIQLDLGAEYDGLVPVPQALWTEEASLAVDIDTELEVRIFKVRDPLYFRWPIQLELLSLPEFAETLPPPEAHRAAMDLRGKADLQKLMEVSGRPYRRRRFFAKTTELSSFRFVDDDDEVKADEIQEFERWEKASAKGAPMPNPTIRVAPVVQDRIEDIVLSL